MGRPCAGTSVSIARRRGALSSAAAILLTLLFFATREAAGQASSEEGPLRVAAAANLSGTVERIVQAYASDAPGLKVEISFGSSGALAAQIRAGAPFDLFLSADIAQPARLAADGFSASGPQAEAGANAGAPRVYAIGVLCVASRHGVDPRGDLGFLKDPAYRSIAVARPELAPYGAAAIAAMEKAGIIDELRGRLVYGANIGQVAQFLSSGAADAAFVNLSSLLVDPSLGKIPWVRLDPATYPPIEQAAIVLNPGRAAARRFMLFVLGPKGRAVLAAAGYALPAAGGP